MLAALLFYLREKLVLAGMCVGLSVLAKLTGAAVLGVIFLYWLITNHRQWKLLVIPVLTSMVSLLAFLPLLEFTITGEISNPVSRIEDMLQVAGSLTTAEALNFTYSPPWYWLMNRGILFYSTKPQFIAVPSLTITWLFIPAVFYMIYQSIRRNQWAWLALAWVACSYLPWVFSSLFIHRFTYIYYFYPVIPVVCLGIGFGLNYLIEKYERNKTDKLAAAGAVAAGGYIFLHLALFVLLSPFVPPLVDWLV
jgi:predicted membrane-bound dolichyl-phosphate-mannose-protein mannosyltransferase